mmetsp:Transcript_53912/g.124117  ORF Transcript_53912/g.124117 Transcript_53912/m.124117 type:complete len:250 (-) Transcript_53912:754-1503(-)
MNSTTFCAISYCTTCATSWKSMPRAARPVDTSTGSAPDWKAARSALRSSGGLSLWKRPASHVSRSSSYAASADARVLAKTSVRPAGPCSTAARSASARWAGSTRTKNCRTRAFSRCSRPVRTHVADGQHLRTWPSMLRKPALGIVAAASTNCLLAQSPARRRRSSMRALCLASAVLAERIFAAALRSSSREDALMRVGACRFASLLSASTTFSTGYCALAAGLKDPASSWSASSSTSQRTRDAPRKPPL